MNVRDVSQRTGKPIVVATIVLFALAVGATAGSLTPSALPAATMHSLANIYDSIASAAFDSSAIVANQNGSLLGNLKYIENQIVWASGSNNIWSLNSGNVGIGTTVPTAKLAVAGTASVSSTLTLAGALVSSFTASSTFAGSLNTTLGLHSLADVSAGGRFLGLGTGSNSFAGSLRVGKGLNVAGTASVSNQLRVYNGGNYFEISENSSGFAHLFNSNINQIYVDATPGNATYSPGQFITNREFLVLASPSKTAYGMNIGQTVQLNSRGILQNNNVLSYGSWIANFGSTDYTGVTVANAIGQEINTVESVGDQGYSEAKPYTYRATVGQQIVPESELLGFGLTLRGYNGSIGLLLSRSAGAEDPGSGRVYPAAKWNIPLFIGKDATAPAGTGFLAQGSTNVASAAQNFMKVTDNWVNGINMSDATFSGVPLRILSFVVTSSSSVGIGTTSPRTQLSIHGTGGQTTAAFTNSGSRAGALLLNETNTLPGSGGAVLFGGTNSASWFGGIKGLLTSGDNSSQGRCGILNAECGDRCRSDRTDAHYGWRQHRYWYHHPRAEA